MPVRSFQRVLKIKRTKRSGCGFLTWVLGMGCGSSSAAPSGKEVTDEQRERQQPRRVSVPVDPQLMQEMNREEEEMAMKYQEDRTAFDDRVDRAHKMADELHHASIPTPRDGLEDYIGEGPKPEVKHRDIEAVLHELYNDCDADHSDVLSKMEIAPLVELLFDRRPDIAMVYSYNIQKVVDDVMSHFDDDHTESIDFKEFVHLCACRPWTSLIPPELLPDLHRLCEKLGVSDEIEGA